VRGVVTRRSGVFPQLRLVRYDCGGCGEVLGPFAFNGDREARPAQCPACGAKGPFTVNAAETLYQNYQKLTLQEAPGSVPPGRLPRHKEVVLLHDLIDCARPGEEIEVTGIYCSGYDPSLNARNGFPVFSTHVEANSIAKAADAYAAARLTDEERAEILRLAADPRIGQRIVKSIAPSIYGHENIKTGLALALFGGVEKHSGGSHRLRGDINVLLLGDPGTAKSQFLKYVEKTAARAVYTTGKGASAVGLTAAVHRDAVTREWTLEGGALVLADRGVCLIDEFDKMNDQDRVSIHEAMEQQSISISKAGIVTSLQARCSVVAAANPVGGRYDPSRTFAENVELSDPILSRFDVLCVVRDVVDPVNDERLAEFVVGSHAASHPSLVPPEGPLPERPPAAANAATTATDADVLPQGTLRKYITYARQHCRPRISQAGHEELLRVYARLRAEAHRTGGMPVAVRHLESMIRMAESHARMHLRDAVTGDDMAVAIRCMVESFVSTQKASAQRDLRRRLRQYVVLPSDYHRVLLHLLRELAREKRQERALMGTAGGREEEEDEAALAVPLRALEDRARELDVADVRGFLESPAFREAGFRLDSDRAMLVVNA
jgi:DNA replication licensing factor MCM2